MNERKSISGGRRILPSPDRPLAFGQPEQKQRDRCDHPGAAVMGNPVKFLSAAGPSALRRDAVEARQPQRAASQINKGDHPAEVLEFPQHDPINQQRRRHAERDNVRERIELAAKWAVMSAQAREPAIEQIENAGGENEPDRVVKLHRRNVWSSFPARRRRCRERRRTRKTDCPPS